MRVDVRAGRGLLDDAYQMDHIFRARERTGHGRDVQIVDHAYLWCRIQMQVPDLPGGPLGANHRPQRSLAGEVLQEPPAKISVCPGDDDHGRPLLIEGSPVGTG